MSENYFNKALADFTNDFAIGGAVRHLADKGFTVKEIKERLDFPAPISKVSELVWKHLIEKGVVRLSPPEEGETVISSEYIKEQNSFGKTSFRRVTKSAPATDSEYIKCEFGKELYKNRKAFEDKLRVLDTRDRDYILGLPWPLVPVWHVADERMKRIMEKL